MVLVGCEQSREEGAKAYKARQYRGEEHQEPERGQVRPGVRRGPSVQEDVKQV